jgi:hypothetical protein
VLDYFEQSLATVERPPAASLQQGGSFWRMEDPVRNPENNRVTIGGMWSHQRQWWDLPDFFKVLVGGYGAGKTLIGCKRILALALLNAPCYVAVVSPTFPLARHTVISTITALLHGKQSILGEAVFWWKFNKTSHEFKIRYRGKTATIIVYSGEDPDSLRGPNLAAAYLDEPFIMEQAVFEQMVARVRHPDAKKSEVFMTGTPEQLNWGYDLCMGELGDQLRDLGVENMTVGTVFASTRGNLALSPDYVKRLEGTLSPQAVKAYVEGKFINLASGLVYYGFDGMPGGAHVKGGFDDIPEGAEIGVGMDFNVNPFCFTAFWKAGPRIHFFKEWELPNADTEYACQIIGEEFPNRHVVIYPDASGSARKTSAPQGKSDFWYIRQAGFELTAPSQNPKRKDRYNAVNGKLKPYARQEAKEQEVSLTVSPKCKKLIKYASVHSHELMTKQANMTHLLDAWSYPVSFLFPINKETLTVGKLSGT